MPDRVLENNELATCTLDLFKIPGLIHTSISQQYLQHLICKTWGVQNLCPHPGFFGVCNTLLDPLRNSAVEIVPRDLGPNNWQAQALSPPNELELVTVFVLVVARLRCGPTTANHAEKVWVKLGLSSGFYGCPEWESI